MYHDVVDTSHAERFPLLPPTVDPTACMYVYIRPQNIYITPGRNAVLKRDACFTS